MNTAAQDIVVYSEELKYCIAQRRCSKLLESFISYGDSILANDPDLLYVTQQCDPAAFSPGKKELLLSYKEAQQRHFFNASPWVFHSCDNISSKLNENITNFVSVTLNLKKKVKDFGNGILPVESTIPELFDLSDQQLKCFNRIADGQTFWITLPLFSIAKQFFKFSYGLDQSFSKMSINLSDAAPEQQSVGDLQRELYLERASRTIQTSYKICLNDREPNILFSKLCNVYSFINLNFAIYEKLQKSDLEKAYVKVLQDRLLKNQLPDISNKNYSNFDKLWFNYFMGKHFISLNDLSKALPYLIESFNYCNIYCTTMFENIMNYLIPAYISHHQAIPHFILGNKVIPESWADFVEFLKKGDLAGINLWIHTNELFLLQQNLMPIVIHIKDLCTARFLQKIWVINEKHWIIDSKEFALLWKNTLNKETEKEDAEILNFLANQDKSNTDLETSSVNLDDLMNQAENIFANLIAKRFLNGYISHEKRKLVVSKTNPFPVFQTRPPAS